MWDHLNIHLISFESLVSVIFGSVSKCRPRCPLRCPLRCPKLSQGKHEKPSSNRLTAGISEILWQNLRICRAASRRSLSGNQGPDSIWTACVSQVCLRTHLELTDSRCVSAWAVEFVHFFAWVLMFLARVRRFCVRGFPKSFFWPGTLLTCFLMVWHNENLFGLAVEAQQKQVQSNWLCSSFVCCVL